MRHLKDAYIDGNLEETEKMKGLFGSVAFGRTLFDEQRVRFSLKVLTNFYRDSMADKTGSPLYVVVPNLEITSVWPGTEFDEVKFGTATTNGVQVVTPAVAIFKDLSGLYLCLKPEGKIISEIGSLGI